MAVLTKFSDADGGQLRALRDVGDVHANSGHSGEVEVSLGKVGQPPQQ